MFLNKPPLISQGIARSLIIAIVLFSSLITLALTAFELYRDFKHDIDLIETQLEEIQNVHVRSIANSLWVVDQRNLKSLVDGIYNLPNMQYLEVKDNEKVWVATGSYKTDNIIFRQYPLTHLHFGESTDIGILTVVANLDETYQRLINKAIVILINNGIKTFFVAIFILLVFHFLVTRHLLYIVQYLRDQKSHTVVTPLKLKRKKSTKKQADELDLLVDEFNLMQQDLQSTINYLEKSEEKFRALFDQAGGYCMILDPNTPDGIPIIIEANKAACSAHGYTREEFIGRSIADIDDEDGKRLVKARTAEIMTGEPFYIENEHVRKDGTTFCVAVNANRIDIGNDTPLILTTEYDITKNKQAEQSLVDSERLSRATFDQAAVGIARVSIDGKWLDVNQKLCEIVGCPRDELLAKNFKDITYKDDLDSDLELVQETLAGKRDSYTMDKRYIRVSGDLIWIRLTVSLVRADDVTPLYFISVIEDINERKKAEEKLREAAAVFRSTAEGVMITDKKGVLLEVNDAFTKITGYSREEVIGQNPRLLSSGGQDNQFYKNMWAELVEHGHWYGEIWNRAKNGVIYPEILTINSLKSEDGKVTGYVGVFADISSLKATEDRLSYLAHHDPLTNLPNRLLFRTRLIHSLAVAKRQEYKIGVVFLDLDHFKNINDTLGHSVGDQLLIESAQRMKAHVREGDTIGHISGDEFCLIFEGIKDTKDTAPLIEKLLRVFDESFVVNDNIMHISASIGVAIYPDNSQDPDELLSFADAAMYEAKEAGRNTYRFYSKAMTEQALEYHIVQSSLKNALGRSQFFLVYQPQIDLNTNSLVGLEVLIRWQHPEQGMIPPNKFIPIAEQSGFIRELGAWILRTACIQGKVWLDEERDFGRMYVNIAGPQLHDEGFFEQVLDCLADTKFPANRLGLEVTEGFVMGASKHAVDTLLKLRNLGIELAIDDFGTGYSSLSYLKSLPINKLKIDQSFVRDIPEDSNDMAIAEAVIAMGRALNMEVIAEGVEKEVQAEFLRSKGCQEAQGYLYGRPLTVSELENWMKSTG
ncbi:MAG: EAL domain-containing protein [Pseudomonadales bacterium]